MKIAINYLGDMIIKDESNKIHIFRNEEREIIGTAIYKWVQNKKSMEYERRILT